MSTAFAARHVRFAYPDGPRVLDDVSLTAESGEVVLTVGSSGSGKSTLLRTANGLVPHATGGRFGGEVTVFGRSTAEHQPRDLADVVGFVHQDPEAQFVVDHVEHDLAFVLENLGLDEATMRRRVEEVLDALGIAHLRNRAPSTLSGGERQRCAIGGALAATPGLLVLDEPTSQLDPQGAEDVLASVARLNTDLGTTVLLAEHRLERAAPLADRAVWLEHGVVVAEGPATDVIVDYPGAPPVAALGRMFGWAPLPLTVRDAQARARATPPDLVEPKPAVAPTPGPLVRRGERIEVARGGRTILRVDDIEVRQGEVIALLGRNGSGKTTLLQALAGLIDTDHGRVRGTGTVGYVPQDPNTLLFAATVRDELSETLRLRRRRDEGAIDHWLAALGIDGVARCHPRSLSGGERQRVAVAAVAVGGAELLLLDEPTRGIDAASRQALGEAVTVHASTGGGVIVATHDIELAARVATRVIVLGDGEVVADGPARHVLAGSLYAPQVLRVLPPFLTVDEVEAARSRQPQP